MIAASPARRRRAPLGAGRTDGAVGDQQRPDDRQQHDAKHVALHRHGRPDRGHQPPARLAGSSRPARRRPARSRWSAR